MKKFVFLLFIAALTIAFMAGCNGGANSAAATIRIAALKGPTTMGMVKLMADNETDKSSGDYQVTMYGTADEIVAKLANGEIDVAAIPCNLASVLYNKTKGAIRVAAINTLGVLYVVENGDQVHSMADLKGKTIYTTGKGTTPEYALNYILSANGIDPQKDVTIEFKSEATEVTALLAQKSNMIAMLPQPYVTIAQSTNKQIRVALDVTQEWAKADTKNNSALITGVLVVRKDFLDKHTKAFNQFLKKYQASTAYVNKNIDAAAALVGKYDIVPEAVAKKAIPQCNITYIDGKEMQTKISGYLQVLFAANPQAVGGTLPDEAFYYKK